MYSFRFFTTIFFFLFSLVFFSFLFSYAPSDERRLFGELSTLQFGSSKSKAKSILTNLLDIEELEFTLTKDRIAKELEKDLSNRFPSKRGEQEAYYDKDFTIHFSSNLPPSFSFTSLKSYNIKPSLRSWNKLISSLRLSFFEDALFKKELDLDFADISEVLVFLSIIKGKMGKPDIGEEFINYSSKNRFVWNPSGKNIYIEFIFSPHRNMFKQVLGYRGSLFIRDKVIWDSVNNYVINIKKILGNLLRKE